MAIAGAAAASGAIQNWMRQKKMAAAGAAAQQQKTQTAESAAYEKQRQDLYQQQMEQYTQLYGAPGGGDGIDPQTGRPTGLVYPGAAGGADTGIPSGVQDIITQMQEAQTGANEANLQRYQEMMGGFEGLGVAAGERQQQIMEQLGGVGEAAEARHEQMMAQMEGLGTAGRARIQRETAQRQAGATQQLISRGLGSTTITSAIERGVAREGEIATQELEERVAGQKAGVIGQMQGLEAQLGMQRVGAMERGGAAATQLGVQKLGAMERRTDLGPDMGQFANLIGALMSGQQGQGTQMPPPLPPSPPTPLPPQQAAAAPAGSGFQVISGGLGPMARRGLTVFGQESKYFGKQQTGGTTQRQQVSQPAQTGSPYRPSAAPGTGATGVPTPDPAAPGAGRFLGRPSMAGIGSGGMPAGLRKMLVSQMGRMGG